MKIAVFGAGGVGAFFGGLLVRGGQDVHFVARGAQLAALRAGGIRIESTLLGTLHIPVVDVVERASEIGLADLVLVCVKTHQAAAIVDDISTLVGESTAIVTLQNGVESDEILAARFGAARVYPAVVYVGATVERPGVVSHVAAGTIEVGVRSGSDPARLDWIRDALAASGQPVRISDDVQRERWRKLVWNAGFNTVSAVTGRSPGELLVIPETRALIVGVMNEVVAVARAQGIALTESVVGDQITWTERAGAIRTSTMVDRERGREMEIDALIGVIVRKGRERGVATPYCEALVALLTALQKR
jgi:2-dehydropantoate 2-reductase